MELGTSIFDSLREILDTLVVKFGYEALINETENSSLNGDYYKMAVEETDNFNTYATYKEKVIRLSGITTNESLIAQYSKDRTTIPKEYRQKVLETNRKYVIDNFVEENPYYRSLMGLPALNDVDFVYVDRETSMEHGVSSVIPVHELDEFSIILLQSIGYIGKLIEENPNKKYLQFLGANKIDIILARGSMNFGLLRVSNTVDKVMYESFVETYNKARDYFGRNIFNKAFAKQYPMYEGFIGLSIIIATLQQITAFSYKNIVYREFFDVATIKAFFDCYNLPYFKAIPLERQRILVKNINKLLHYKSTNKVIYDLCSILGFESMDIYQYYLVKQHNINHEGLPIFADRELGDGTVKPNYDTMYSLFFQPVDLKDPNPTLAFTDTTSRIKYEDMIYSDPYWYDDEETREAIYESDFNFTETKYIGMKAMYRLTKMIFEVTHFYRVIQDNKKYTDLIMMDLPKLFAGEKFSFFDVVAFSLALMSKRMGYNGEIMDTTTKVMSILGFDFTKDYETIRNIIMSDKYISSRRSDIMKYISKKPLVNATDINGLYVNIRDLHKYLKDAIAETKDIHEYRALKKFYKAVLVMDDTNEMFKLKDGTIAKTITEYLDENSPLLAKFIKDLKDDDEDSSSRLSSAIVHIISRFELVLPDLQYLFILTDNDSTMMQALIELIRFFKSYTVDLAGYSIAYLLDDRDEQMIKILHEVVGISSTEYLNDYHYTVLMTNFLSILASLEVDDTLAIEYKKTQHMAKFYKEDMIKFLHELKQSSNFLLEEKDFNLTSSDYLLILAKLEAEDNIVLRGQMIDQYIQMYQKDSINIEDSLMMTSMFMSYIPEVKKVVIHEFLFIEALADLGSQVETIKYGFETMIHDKLRDKLDMSNSLNKLITEMYTEERFLELQDEYLNSTMMEIGTRNKIISRIKDDIVFFIKDRKDISDTIKKLIVTVTERDEVESYDYMITDSSIKLTDNSIIARDKLYKD